MRFLLFLLLLPAFSFAQARKQKLPPALREVSGMTRTAEGKLWLLNDSGNPAELFLYDYTEGKVLKVVSLPVKNVDWEDLCQDRNGKLFIGDFGNNRNARKNLRIFTYDPASAALDSIIFTYPDQQDFPPGDPRRWNFNCEAMVFMADSLHLFSKNVFNGDGRCKHYVLPAKPGKHTAILRDSTLFKKRVITGASLSQDGKTLVLTSYHFGKRFGLIPYTKGSLIAFTGYQGSRFFKGKQRWTKLRKFLLIRQYESVTPLNGDKWLIANEGNRLYKQRIKSIRIRP